MKNKKSLLALLMAILLFALTGCSSKEEKPAEGDDTLHVLVAATYMSDELLQGLKDELATLTDVPTISVAGLSMGDTEKDPMGAMAGMTQISAMMSSGEVEVLITDAQNARRYGDNGQTYVALETAFTAEQIAAFAATPTGVEVVDDNGDVTGEMSAACGVVLTQSASALTGFADMQMFILNGSEHMDAAKAVFEHLAKME